MANTIVLRGKGIRKEGTAAGAITPGHIVERDASGTLVVHATTAKNAQRLYAVENELIGKGIGDAYASGDNVLLEAAVPGMEINALVAAAAPAIVVGDFLESAGDGTVVKIITDAATDDTQRVSVVGVALESVDNSGGGSAVRIKMEVV